MNGALAPVSRVLAEKRGTEVPSERSADLDSRHFAELKRAPPNRPANRQSVAERSFLALSFAAKSDSDFLPVEYQPGRYSRLIYLFKGDCARSCLALGRWALLLFSYF